MERIPLTKGKEALVDDRDYDYLMQWKWYILDGLNNRRENLRPMTKRQNAMNREPRRGLKSGYKGVCWLARSGKFAWLNPIPGE